VLAGILAGASSQSSPQPARPTSGALAEPPPPDASPTRSGVTPATGASSHSQSSCVCDTTTTHLPIHTREFTLVTRRHTPADPTCLTPDKPSGARRYCTPVRRVTTRPAHAPTTRVRGTGRKPLGTPPQTGRKTLTKQKQITVLMLLF